MSDPIGNDDLDQGLPHIEFEVLSKYVPLYVRRKVINQMICDFPEPMKDRIRALKLLQLKSTELEADFYTKIHDLECEYQDAYNELHDKRSEIVSGAVEPKPEECIYTLEVIDADEKLLESKLFEVAKSNMSLSCASHTDETPGIPDFWLQIFRNIYLLSDMLEDHDEAALKFLVDVKVQYTKEPMGFILEFHFAPNPYFTNKVLAKEYFMSCVPKPEDPFAFDGPEITHCKGCVIDWLPGEDLTKKPKDETELFPLRNPKKNESLYKDSFFTFFSPPECDREEMTEDMQQVLTSDFEVAHYFRERVVPRAILYYTCEAIDSEEEDDEEDEDGSLFGEEAGAK